MKDKKNNLSPIILIAVFVMSIISGILYRLGGTGGAWWKNTKMRDIGVPIIALVMMLLLGYHISWMLVLSTILLFASLTTYWKKINKFFGDTEENCRWYNWYVHGFVCGLAYLPMIFVGVPILVVLGRSFILAGLVTLSSELIDEVFWEEFCRGFFIVLTLIIFGG